VICQQWLGSEPGRVVGTTTAGPTRRRESRQAVWRQLCVAAQMTGAEQPEQAGGKEHDADHKNPASMLYLSLRTPMTTGEITSPRRWITKILSANPAARMEGCVTLARIVLVGPVLKNRQKQARKISTQPRGTAPRAPRERAGNQPAWPRLTPENTRRGNGARARGSPCPWRGRERHGGNEAEAMVRNCLPWSRTGSHRRVPAATRCCRG